jgi:hypothetical protein
MGAGRGERVREVSCEELATHASRDNCWIGIAGRVRVCRRALLALLRCKVWASTAPSTDAHTHTPCRR